MGWVFLTGAIVFELLGTTSMKLAAGFTRLWPSVAVFCAYGLSLVTLTLALRSIPLSVAYAIWSGVGTACTVAIGCLFFDEPLTTTKLVSAGLIVAGVIGLQLD